jgi:CubicO group peptidase (beta-lactamase class C family)
MIDRNHFARAYLTLFLTVCAAAGCAIDPRERGSERIPQSAFGPREGVLFWTPEQQRIGYPNMNRVTGTRAIHRGPEMTFIEAQHATFALPLSPVDLSGVGYELNGKRYTLGEFLEERRTAGLLVIKDGRILYEHYGFGHTAASKWTSFSVAKSVVSMLVGAAIRDGYIKSIDDQVTDYLPLLKDTAYAGVSVKQVLQMSSGVAWNEDYTDAKSDVSRIGTIAAQSGSVGLIKYLGALPRIAKPGEKFNYNTGETHLAGAIVRAAVGNNLATYLSQKIWSQFAMESDGYWMLADEFGAEHGGCCISATLRDYGRIGLFALRDGVLNDGTRVLPVNWMRDSTSPSAANPQYGYLWWLQSGGDYAARGIFGQTIQLYSKDNVVIVTHGLWPVATSDEYSAHRMALMNALRLAVAK